MISVAPGQAFVASLVQDELLSSTDIGHIGVTVSNEDGTVVTARTTAGITFIDQQFKISLTAPSVVGNYIITWDFPNRDLESPAPYLFSELLSVTISSASAPELQYAQVADLDLYMGGANNYLPSAAGFATKFQLLEQCQRDIDYYCGYGRPTDQNTGLKFWTWITAPGDSGYIPPYQRDALARAVCAQAEYRIELGPEFFTQPPNLVTEGPDYTISGGRPRLAPKALYEMRRTGLMRLTARAVA